jgi:hypothetical protein
MSIGGPIAKTVLLGAVLTASCLLAQVVKLTPEEFVVKAGVARYWKFSVTGSAGRVAGQFRASGGAHNDIRVLITDSDECENYINGNRSNVFYDSGQKTVGRFDVNLNQASYCIIFDNRNSIVSAKEVQARIALVNQ